jgi:GDPmannose 4,6-dehydratase
MHACSGILFNHESPLRGAEFVTRKITLGLARVRQGQSNVLELGNLDAQRDWGFAGDYVKGMWLMLSQDRADDFVLATGETHRVREFVDKAAQAIGFDLEWEGEGVAARGVDRLSGKLVVRVNPEFYRPAEVDLLIGDSTRAQQELGWKPETSFDQLVDMMARADYDRVVRGLHIA